MPAKSRILSATLRPAVAASALLVGVAPAAAQDAPFGQGADTDYASTLWNELAEAHLVGENSINTVPYEGTPPHGLILETLYRDLEVDGHTGLVIVKRNYGPEGLSVEDVQRDRREHMGSITVMYQREQGYDPENQNWFWAKYLADGSLDENEQGVPLAGRVAKGADQGCIACHSAAGDDYIYTFDLMQ